MRDTVLLVDSSINRRSTLRDILEEHFNILEANNLTQAQFLLEQNNAALAAVMPNIKLLEGNEGRFLMDQDQKDLLADIPVIAVTPSNSPEADNQAFDWGVDYTIHYPFHPALVERSVRSIISLYSHKWNLEKIVKEQQSALRHSNEIMVDTLSTIIECRSVESGQHVLRIRNFTRILLEELAATCPEYNLDKATIQSISSAAALHDIGKIAIPDAILNKPGPLTDEEREIMKNHSTAGSSILERLGGMGNDEYLRYAYNICRYHHERWDGGGYPDGLVGEAIPICAQVVGLADVFDALTTKRVYKDALPCSEAISMILRGECGEFSPKLLECFKHVQNNLFSLAEYYADGVTITSDRITEPLAPPGRTSANALQGVLAKYDILLHYLNAMVLEIDLDRNMYHTIYNPNPDLSYLQNASNLTQAMHMMAEQSVHPDDRMMLTDQFNDYLEMFFDSGLRRSMRRYRIQNADGVYRHYDVTIFRVDTGDGSRKALGIWEPSSEQQETITPKQIGDSAAKSQILEIPQYCRYDRWLTLEEVTEEFSNLIGYTADEIHTLFHSRLVECILPECRAEFHRQFDAQLARSNTVVVEFPVQRKDGSIIWILAKGILITGRNGIEYIYGTMTDISAMRRSEKSNILPIQSLSYLLEESNDVVFSWDPEVDLITFSGNLKEKFGYEDTKAISLRDVKNSHIHPDDLDLMDDKLGAFYTGLSFVEFPVRIVNAAGRYTWNLIRAFARRNEHGHLLKVLGIIIGLDTEWQFASVQQEASSRDSLTKLLNKEASRRQIETYLAGNKEQSLAAMVIIDLDNFKNVNDTYGHLFGDTLLTRIALEIGGLFRDSDVVARIGGDEFLVFVPDIPQRTLVEQRSTTLIHTIEELFDGQLKSCGLSCSVGISFTPDHGTAYQELFQHADKALYQAKSLGKGRFAIYEPMSAVTSYSSKISRKIDSDDQPQWNRNSLAHFVFEMLYESSDVEETVRSLLAIVGKQSNVSRVYIFENDASDTTCSNTFEWCNEGVSSEIDNLQKLCYETDLPGFASLFNEQGVLYCADIRTLPEPIRGIVEAQGIRSILLCAIRDNGRFKGYVGFDDNNKVRLWTKEQIDLLVFLSQIISTFLLKKRIQDQTAVTLNDLRNVLNNQNAWVYVIEPETYRLHFINEQAKGFVPNAAHDLPCYQALMGRNDPCEHCPIHVSGRTSVFDNPHLGCKVRATADTVHWKGAMEWLVTCREIQP